MEAVTKAAQQEELERRKRLEQQRKDYQANIPTLPLEFLPGKQNIVPSKDQTSVFDCNDPPRPFQQKLSS